MKKISILEHEVQYFAGIKKLIISPEGRDVVRVFGDNGAGKTGLVDSWWWLITGKNSKGATPGSTRFPIKPTYIDYDHNETRHPKVKTKLAIEEGGETETVVLMKEYLPTFRKETGTGEHYFDGNTKAHYINGAELPQSEYENFINTNFLDYEKLKMITDPVYFAEDVHWEDRRKIIIDIIDPPSVVDILREQGEEKLADSLKHQNDITDWIKSQESNLRKIDAKIEKIQYYLEENDADINAEKLQQEYEDMTSTIDSKQEMLDELRTERAAAQAGGRSQVENEIRAAEKEVDSLIREEIQELERQKNNLELAQRETKSDIQRAKVYINNAKEKLDDISTKYREWETRSRQYCPECDQRLPEEKIEQFNIKRAEKLKELKKEGIQKQKEILEHKKEIEELQEQKEDYAEGLKELNDEIAEAREGDNLPGVKELREKIDSLEASLDTESDGVDNAEKEEEIKALQQEISRLTDERADIKARLNSHEKFQEHIDEEKALQQEYEERAKTVETVKHAQDVQLEKIDNMAEGIFGDLTNVVMYDYTQEGTPKPTCRIEYDGKDFEGALNDGHKFRVGLKIIDTLAAHFGVAVPLMIDNKESFTAKAKSIGQRWCMNVIPEKKVKELAEKKTGIELIDATGKTPMAVYTSKGGK